MYKFKRYLFKKGYERAKKEYGDNPSSYLRKVIIAAIKDAKSNNGITRQSQCVDIVFTNKIPIMSTLFTSYGKGMEGYLDDNWVTFLGTWYSAPELAETTKCLLGSGITGEPNFNYLYRWNKGYNNYDLVVFDTKLHTTKEAFALLGED